MGKQKIGIIGATGFTGSELVRILMRHPDVEIAAITSESKASERFSDVHPFFQGIADHRLVSAEEIHGEDFDLLFLALPHGVSMSYVERFIESKAKIIDLSGDFRLSSKKVYETWYKKDHTYPEGFNKAVFGLPELFRKNIASATLVANPGCYPTSAILGLAPLIDKGIIQPDRLVIDSKSGITGAGVKPKPVNHFSAVNDNFKAYGLKHHRHTIEIQETLSRLDDQVNSVQFTPHLLPVDRGILSTAYSQPHQAISDTELKNLYTSFYKDAPFVRWRDDMPTLKDVRGTNLCDVHATYDERTGNIITISTIDNLVKGAAGQAVQNMNLMLGLAETTGLDQIPMQP